MRTMLSKWHAPAAFGLVAGALAIYIDNVAFEGEASPIVVVITLLVVTATAAAVWGRRGWLANAIAWACVPAAHVAKHLLGLPDTLHPNTYRSIAMLAVFTLVVAVVGTAAGTLVHRPRTRT